jgi:probable HAF family extracellular repeat protein
MKMHCAVCSFVALAGSAVAQPSFHELGFLSPEGLGPSLAFAISADGTVVVGTSNGPNGFEAFRWTLHTGMVGLGAFPNPGSSPESEAFSISRDGRVIGGGSQRPGSLNENGSPYRWTAEEGLVYLGSLGGTEGGAVGGANLDGSILVGDSSSADFSYQAFVWRGAGLEELPHVEDQVQSAAAAVTPDGSTIVGSVSLVSVGNARATVWTLDNGHYTPRVLPLLQPGTLAGAADATPDGSVVIGQSSGRAVRWIGGAPEDLGILPGHRPSSLYYASAISADGQTIVGLGDLDPLLGTGTAVVWDPQHGMRDLNQVLTGEFGLDLHGFFCFAATAISDDGLTIAGYGFANSGEQEAFVADLHAAAACYPNCDGSSAAPLLNVNDFICFQTKFAAGDSYTNCDGSTAVPVLNINDFICFQQSFAAGCQ